MEVRLMSLGCTQLARVLGLVRRVEPVELEGQKEWALLIRGRGFTRLLEQEILHAPNLIRGAGWSAPRPRSFRGRQAAVACAQDVGLLPRKKTWAVRDSEA